MIDKHIVYEDGVYVPVIRIDDATIELPFKNTLKEAQALLGCKPTWQDYSTRTIKMVVPNKRDQFRVKLREEDEDQGNIQDW